MNKVKDNKLETTGYELTEFDISMINSMQFVSNLEDIEKEAIRIANFIDDKGRVPLNIEEYRLKYDPQFQPECWHLNKSGENITDTEFSSRDTKHITDKDQKNILESKKMCSSCPIRLQCSAVGIASRKNTRKSKNEKSIPGTEEMGQAITLNDFCIYGGFSPGERRVIYNIICHILEEKDKMAKYNEQQVYK